MALSRRVALASAGALLVPSMARAQAWPQRPLRLVIPFPPGGAQDNLGRLVAARLSETLGQQVVPDNRPGASGILAAEIVARAPADGYTVLLGNIASHTINPHVQKVPYDPFADFVPAAMVAATPNMLCASPSFPHDTVAKLVAAAKAAPGKLNYGSSGASTSPSLSMELFKLRAGIDIQLAAYKGAAPAATDAMAGHIPLVISNLDSLRVLAQTGKLKAIATTGPQRSPTMPDTPTFAESGYPDVVLTSWSMLMLPAATPPAIALRLHADMTTIKADTDTRGRLAQMGFDPVTLSPDQLAPYIRAEHKRWGEVIRAAGIKME